ncbi:hypothetical protein Bca4012_037815 [Brassica carinata]
MEEQQAQGVKPSQEDRAKKGKAVVGKKRRTAGPPEDGVEKMAKEMEEQQAQSVKPSQDDHEKKGNAVVGKKRKAAALPVDNLPFLQREEKRPIGPINHPIHVTHEVILPIDPFVTPEFPRFSKLGYWMGLQGIHCVPFYINRREKEKDFFEYMDNAENNLNEEGGGVGEVVRGLKTPRKIWLEDVDVVYGVVHERKSDHYTGVEIHLMDNTITLFHCGLHRKGIRVEKTPLIKQLALLIPAIKMELMGEEINYKAIVPFQVKKGFRRQDFLSIMLERKSLGLKNMTNINDDNAMELRSKLCCEIFDQFMDKDFEEGCRK